MSTKLTGGVYDVLALCWASVPVDVQFVVLPWTIVTEPMPASLTVIIGGNVVVASATLPASGSGSASGPPGDNWQYAYFTSPDSTTLTFGFSRTAREAPNVAQAIAVRKTWRTVPFRYLAVGVQGQLQLQLVTDLTGGGQVHASLLYRWYEGTKESTPAGPTVTVSPDGTVFTVL